VWHDLILSPFDANGPDLLEAARTAERSGFRGVWTYDHLSASMLDRGLSRDPFTVLGAIAAGTTAIHVGPLVANMMNRHPVQLANAAATLQSISGGRAMLGMGSGAAPGSRFSGEQLAIGTSLHDAEGRRRRLIDTIAAVRALWSGVDSFESEFFTLEGIGKVVGDENIPPIVVGAGSASMVELAVEHADGVNILGGIERRPLIEHAAALRPRPSFDISVHVPADLSHPQGGDIDALAQLGVDGRILAVTAPFDHRAIESLGSHLLSG